MQQKRSVALVGSGNWGRNIARVLSQLGALKLICDADENVVAPLAAELDAEFTADFERVLERADINAVVIATPAVSHAALGKQALQAGKHVYLEKPIALSIEDAKSIAAMARETGLVLMIGHLLQYHPGFMKLLELVREGALGKVTYAFSNRLNQGQIRTEENVIWSLAPHDFSMLLAVIGEAPSAVTARGASIVQPEIPDLSIINMAFPGGAKAHIFCSWLSPYKEHRISVIGERGMAVFDDTPRNWTDKSLTFFEHRAEFRDGKPKYVKGAETRIVFEQSEPLKNELAHFLECTVNRATPRTGAHEAIPVLEAMERAQRAMETANA